MSNTADPIAIPNGKIPASLLASLLSTSGALPAGVRVGPALGEDGCVLEVGEEAVVVATDPITLTGSEVGGHAVLINANDVAVMGARPRWYLATVLLPEGTTDADVRALFASTRHALEDVGAALVGGHTEVTAAVRQPVVVGQMIGVCGFDELTPSSAIREGEVVLQVGSAPIEGAAVLAVEAPHLRTEVSTELFDTARGGLRDPGISVVDAAMLCRACGATAMHDPTEGGLASGLHELARAGGVRLELDAESVQWFEAGVAVCRAAGADPWGTLASGTLLAAFPETDVDRALEALAQRAIPAARIAVAREGAGVMQRDGKALAEFARDEVARVLEIGARSASDT